MTALDSSDLPAKSRNAAFLWAAFLGTSWTWCIGMFLPVLLIRDTGAWGWVFFAIPNVVGAAAMGWTLKSPQQSRQMVEAHPAACRAFSIVTIAFHVFFVLWFVPRLVGLPAAAIVFPLVAIYLLFTVSRGRFDLVAGVGVWMLSLVLCALFLRKVPATLPTFATLPSANAIYLLPVCLFGFALCPYLDLTFHRARQALQTPVDSHIGFGIGFGICFFSMIVFSLIYSTALAPLVGENWRDHVRPVWGWIIATHMIVQAAYTLSVHARSYVETRPKPASIFSLLIVCQIALLAAFAAAGLPRFANLDFGEICYRFFMAFYGLIFPAYVWMFMLPGRSVNPAAVRAFMLAVLVALPMYFAGFILNRMAWLVPGVVCVLLGQALVRQQKTISLSPNLAGSSPDA
jgi:hypothetical protein